MDLRESLAEVEEISVVFKIKPWESQYQWHWKKRWKWRRDGTKSTLLVRHPNVSLQSLPATIDELFTLRKAYGKADIEEDQQIRNPRVVFHWKRKINSHSGTKARETVAKCREFESLCAKKLYTIEIYLISAHSVSLYCKAARL